MSSRIPGEGFLSSMKAGFAWLFGGSCMYSCAGFLIPVLIFMSTACSKLEQWCWRRIFECWYTSRYTSAPDEFQALTVTTDGIGALPQTRDRDVHIQVTLDSSIEHALLPSHKSSHMRPLDRFVHHQRANGLPSQFPGPSSQQLIAERVAHCSQGAGCLTTLWHRLWESHLTLSLPPDQRLSPPRCGPPRWRYLCWRRSLRARER